MLSLRTDYNRCCKDICYERGCQGFIFCRESVAALYDSLFLFVHSGISVHLSYLSETEQITIYKHDTICWDIYSIGACTFYRERIHVWSYAVFGIGHCIYRQNQME